MIFKELDEVILIQSVDDLIAGMQGMIVEIIDNHTYLVDFTQEYEFYNCDESAIKFYRIDEKLLEEK